MLVKKARSPFIEAAYSAATLDQIRHLPHTQVPTTCAVLIDTGGSKSASETQPMQVDPPSNSVDPYKLLAP